MIDGITFKDEDGDTLKVELCEEGQVLFTTTFEDYEALVEISKQDLPTLISTLIAFDEENDREKCEDDD